MGKFSRDKGLRLERGVAKRCREGGLDAERQQQQRRVSDVADVHVNLKSREGTVLLECKNYAKPTVGLILDALKQCDGYVTDESQFPAAVVHVPRTSTDIVHMRLSEFIRLLAALDVVQLMDGDLHGEDEHNVTEPVDGVHRSVETSERSDR